MSYQVKDKSKLNEISKMANAWQKKQQVKTLMLEAFAELYALYEDFESTDPEDIDRAFDAVRVSIHIYKSM